MNQFDPYSDPRFDDRLNESDARSRQHARRRAAEARSQSRSSQEGSYASGRRPPTSRHSTRQPRNHFDAREEFARLDEEAHERDMRRIARQHGIAPRSVGELSADPYERATMERMPARRLRERAEDHGHGQTDEYHSERYRDQSRARVEDIEDPAVLEEIHHSGDHPRGRRQEDAPSPLAALVGALPFFGERAEEEEPHSRTSARGRDGRSARTGRNGGTSRTRSSHERDDAFAGEDELEREDAADAGRSRAHRQGDRPRTPRERSERKDRPRSATERRRDLDGEPNRVGAEGTRAKWRSSNGTLRNERRPRERSRSGYSSHRNQVDMSPLGRGRLAGGNAPTVPIGFIVRVVIALAVLALVVFAVMNISRAVANAMTITVTVDGTEQKINGSKDLNALLAAGIATQPGNLVAVDGSVLAEGGGYPVTAMVNGTMVTDYAERLPEGADIQISRGADIMEPSHQEERALQADPKESGTGPVHRVSQEGSEGRAAYTVGDVSGIAVEGDMLQEATPRTYAKQYVDTGGEKVIALTFDDGPLPEYTNQVLDVLKDNDAKATFFTLGTRIEEDGGADCVKRAVSEGHQVCTHSYDHAAGSGQGVNMGYMTQEEQRTEVEKGQEAIKNASGQDASKVFRSPGGNFPIEVWRNVEDLITAEIGWNVDTTDWKQPGSAAIEKALLSADPGDIILMHDGGGNRQQTVDALRSALPQLKEAGYRFVTIDELMQYSLVDEQPKSEQEPAE